MTSLVTVPYDGVTVAPLVLLSVLDHYERTHTPKGKRCLGAILGDATTSTIRVTNSFALPFEEDDKDPDVWFLDQNYIENMNEMCKKINAKEKLIGWYHSGPKLRASDLKINDLFKKYTTAASASSSSAAASPSSSSSSSGFGPLLLIVDVEQSGVGLPIDAYVAVEQVKDDGTSTERIFVHLPSTIEAEEAEEIGVEHLLRDVRDPAAGSLSIRLTNQLKSLQGLQRKLNDIVLYLNKVIAKELPVNHAILGKLQDVFNLLPNLGYLGGEDETAMDSTSTLATTRDLLDHSNNLQKALTVRTNDELMLIYISNLVRTIIALDDLIDNKIQNKKLQEKLDKERESGKSKDAATSSSDASNEDGKTDDAKQSERKTQEDKNKTS